jgi:aryl-alcohol dehydrogenase-like predicted oxidoreductase
MSMRKIPKTREAIPSIGLGTWQTFDVGTNPAERAPLSDVLQRFFAAGGRVLDSSPMYGRSEEVSGELLEQTGLSAEAFIATKVWTRGKQAGLEQMERSFKLFRRKQIDLMQIHNLLDWQIHLPVLREWKSAGRIRYVGVTHYAHSAFDELEKLLATETLDFIQLPYNLADRKAEERLLPAAAASGTAVLVMRPFAEGDLFRRVKGKQLPAWAADFDCTSWAQFFLKFILGHPAVTSPIPATSSPKHLADNVQAGLGRLPDAATRRKMIQLLAG